MPWIWPPLDTYAFTHTRVPFLFYQSNKIFTRDARKECEFLCVCGKVESAHDAQKKYIKYPEIRIYSNNAWEKQFFISSTRVSWKFRKCIRMWRIVFRCEFFDLWTRGWPTSLLLKILPRSSLDNFTIYEYSQNLFVYLERDEWDSR